jgi:alpha-mannosidase
VPPLGIASYRVTLGGAPGAVRDAVAARGGRLVASWCRVAANADGLALVPRRGRPRAPLGAIVSELDEGDTYTFDPAPNVPPLLARWGPPRVVREGPLVAVLARDFEVGERARGTLFARLDAGSRLVRLVVDGENLAGNHRLRILFPGPRGRERHVADMHFGPVTRVRRAFDRRRYPLEWPVTTAPMHRYVSVAGGLTVFARGLFEYEPLPDGSVAVTLIRAVGDLSRGDLAARLGHAAWPAPTPGAQERGQFRAELAVALETVAANGAASAWDAVERLAEEFHAPLAGLMLRYGMEVPGAVGGPALEGAGLAFTALKPAEDGRGLILRCANLTARAVRGAWLLPFRVRRASRARLDERPLERLRTTRSGRRIPFRAGPREVVTVRVTGEWGAGSGGR